MADALMSGVSGLKAYQTMLDVAGNNLANVNTTAFKSSRVAFADLLSETAKEASQPTGTVGGTNPQQIGSGVTVSGIDRNLSQGSLVSTGRDLDMAIQGNGYFVLNDGNQDVYTRVGTFAVDADFYLVDPGTGYHVQRIGSEGLSEGFQSPSNNDIRIPKDVTLDAKATLTVNLAGNLSAVADNPTAQVLDSGFGFADAGGAAASLNTLIADLHETSGIADGDTITITGVGADGQSFTTVTLTIDADVTTMGDLIDNINTALADGGQADATASISAGHIRITEDTSGYTLTDVSLAYTPIASGTMTLPKQFDIIFPGGLASEVLNDLTVFDTLGIAHTVAATYVRKATNTWDLVITSIGGDVELVDRRIENITFLGDGRFGGLSGSPPDASTFQVRFSHDPANTRSLTVNFDPVGSTSGLTQTGSAAAVTSKQDGYASGTLQGLFISRVGTLTGKFSNGQDKVIASMRLATFQNPSGLSAVGNSFYIESANSGSAVATRALDGGAGALRGGSLENSNVNLAEQFVSLIQAQNGYQANARTIKVTNEMLRELTNLIR